MKFTKFTKGLVSVLTVCAALFVACSKDEEQKGGNNESEIIIPDNPPIVSGGSLTKGGDGENRAVTYENRQDFLDVFCSAYDSYYSQRGIRALLDEYEKENTTSKGSYKIEGDISGYVEFNGSSLYSQEWKKTNKSSSVYGGAVGTFKYFDFSNNNLLFLGGATGIVETINETYNTSNRTVKINGKIDFQGAYEGKVVFDNVEFLLKEIHDSDWNDIDTLDYKIQKGKFYVESNGEKIDLPDSLVLMFGRPRSEYTDYGNDITVNMPSVPSAPNGRLSDHAGNNAVVNAENVNMFFKAFVNETSDRWGVAPRGGYEEKTNTEELKHGEKNGYYLSKTNDSRENLSQENNSTVYNYSYAKTIEYNDYSNKDKLYFGGGYGEAMSGFYKFGMEISSEQKNTTIVNGKVTFNGNFNGTLDFQNFEYVHTTVFGEFRSNSGCTYLGGKVTIGGLDVTDMYVRYVLKGEKIDVEDDEPIDEPINDLGNDLLKSGLGWIDPSFTFADNGEVPTCGAWYYRSDYAEITNVQVKDGEISWTAALENEDDENDIWPYAEMSVAFDAGALNADAVIHLIYTSDRDIELVLNDNTVLDNGLKVGDEGISYSAKLKSGTNVERNLEVSSWGTGNKKDFTQPDWADDLYGVDGTYDLDISKIEGFTISAAENYGKTVNIKITRFIVEGLYDDK